LVAVPHAFTTAERYAVFTVHRERCWFCREPVSLAEMEVDHVIPESLDGTELLGAVLAEMGLPPDFGINAYANWRPTHRACNRMKSDRTFKPSPLIQACLEEGIAKAPRVAEVAQSFVSDRKIDNALHQLMAAKEKGALSERQRATLSRMVLEFHDQARDAEDRGKPLQLAPWLTVVSEDAYFFTVKGPGGMYGIRPKADKLDPSWDCPRCGPTGWNGARCVTCGMLDDGD
jgi:hypothetical protein